MELYRTYNDRVPRDVADYTGPIEVVDIPGRGKGIVVTKDVKKGTLLLAAKSYVTDFRAHNVGKLVQMIFEKLQKNPQSKNELFSLYAGDSFPREESIPTDPKMIEERLVKIVQLNAFGVPDKCIGIWILPSFTNHSCLGMHEIFLIKFSIKFF